MKRVVVLGATSAIAQHVARLYAEQGASLFLAARNPERLAALVVKTTQLTDPPPSILVNCGPLTLRRLSSLSTVTRLYGRPPVA